MPPDTYLTQARRDADLYYADEIAAVADLIARAQTTATTQQRDINVSAESGVNALWRDYGTEAHKLRAQATAMNMGMSGAAMAGQIDLTRTKSMAASDIRAQAAGKLMNITDQLGATIAEAARARNTVAAKKTLLIGQLRDKYRGEAEDRARAQEQLALQKEQNRIAWFNARTARKTADIEAEKNKPPTAFDRIGFSKTIDEMRLAYRQGGELFDPDQLVPGYLSMYPKATESDKQFIFQKLYGAGWKVKWDAWKSGWVPPTFANTGLQLGQFAAGAPAATASQPWDWRKVLMGEDYKLFGLHMPFGISPDTGVYAKEKRYLW